MARSDNRRRSVRAEAPLAADRPVQLQVERRRYSSRGDQSANRTAEAIANAMSAGTEFVQERKIRKNIEGREEATADIATGAGRDAENRNEGYMARWEQRDAEYDANRLEEEIPAYLEGIDAENLTRKELQEAVDAKLQEHFAGLEHLPDSAYTRHIAPKLQRINDAVMATWDEQQLAEIRGEQRIRTVTNADDRLAELGKAAAKIDDEGERNEFIRTEMDGIIKYFMDETNDIYDGDNKKREMAVMLMDFFDRHNMPEAYSLVPEKFADGSLTGWGDPGSAIAGEIQRRQAGAFEMQSQRIKQRKDDWEARNQYAIATNKANDQRLAEAGDPALLERLQLGSEDGIDGFPPRIYTAKEVEAKLNTYSKAQADRGVAAERAQRYHEGDSVDLSDEEYEKDFQAFTIHTAATLERDEDMTPEQRQSVLQQAQLERSVVNGRLPKQLKRFMSVNTSNPEKYKRAAEMYAQLEKIRPGFVLDQIGDADAMQLGSYRRILEDTGNETLALQRIEAYDHSLTTAPGAGAEIAVAVEAAVLTLNEERLGPFDYPDNPLINKRVAKEVRHYVALGYTAEQAGDYALAAIQARSVRAGNHLWQKNAGFGGDPEAELQWRREQEAEHRGVPVESIQIVPHPKRPGEMLIENVDDPIQGSGYIMPIRTNAEMYKQSQLLTTEQLIEKASKGEPEEREEAAKIAFHKLYTQNPYATGAMAGTQRATQQAQWAAMPAADRELLIEAELPDVLWASAEERARVKWRPPIRHAKSGVMPGTTLPSQDDADWKAMPKKERDALITEELSRAR